MIFYLGIYAKRISGCMFMKKIVSFYFYTLIQSVRDIWSFAFWPPSSTASYTISIVCHAVIPSTYAYVASNTVKTRFS